MNIRSLGYVLIESTDPQQWLQFGTEVLGMMVAPGMPDDGNIYLKMDERPFRWAIVPGDTDRLQLCGLELLDEGNFNAAREELAAAGVEVTEGTAAELAQRRVRELIRFKDPSGNVLELYHGADLDYAKFISPLGIAAFETGFNGNSGFGHAVLPTPNREQSHRFYTEVLGLGDSDFMHFKFSDDPADPGLGMNFLHVENPRHHSIGLFGGEHPAGCIHLMVEVKDVDEVGYCLDRVLQRNIHVSSTLGRHTNDRMLSFYMRTPGGFELEFGCEGLKMDWTDYTPTKTTLPSIWGHKFSM